MFDKASLKLGLDKAVLQDINRKGSLNGVKYHFILERYLILSRFFDDSLMNGD